MSSLSQARSLVSIRYATAFLDLAHESKVIPKVEKDIKALDAMIESSADLKTLLNSPVISKADQAKAIDAIAKKAKLQSLTQNFLNLLVQNNRLNALEGIITAFHKELSKRRGELRAHVQTASALTAKQTKDLQDAMSKTLKSDVSIHATIDPELLGGMIVTVGSNRVDDSIARKLERLRVRMGNKQANQNNLKEVG